MLAGVLVSLEVVCNRKSPKEGNTSTFRNCSPCFAERPSATSGFDGKLSSSLFVTVLVLLEDPLQLCAFMAWTKAGGKLQSLFCWKTLCNQEEAIVHDVDMLLQSLFCWKTLCNHPPDRQHRPGPDVIVLVLLEDPLQQKEGDKYAITANKLQSLFCWKTLCNSRKFTPIA